ncbi:MAG: flagellar basal-body MS-ring/collar protein FliF [Acidobacteriota bacterium]
MPGFWAQLQAINGNLSLNQKLSMLALGAVTLFGILGFVHLFNQSGYRPLATDADAATQQQILDLFQQQGISAAMSEDGRSILVSADVYRDADRLIRSGGLLDDGRVGLEIFDQNDWSITDFGQKMKFLRAKQGQIEQSIRSMSDVKDARVILSLQEDSLYVERLEPARATVQLTPYPGRSLSPNVVQGARQAVVGAVKGMAPENVSVIGPSGILLSSREGDGQFLSQRLLQLRRKLEDELTLKVLGILEPFASKVEVGTSLEIDFDQVQQKELLKDPVLLGEERSIMPAPGAAGVGGIPGFASNQGAAPQNGAQTPAGSATRETRNYSFSTIERLLNSPGGSIQGISMAVLIDHKTVQGQDDRGRPVDQRVPWPEQELETLRELVAAAIFLKPERGDKLTLVNVLFPELPSRPVAVETAGFFERNHYIIMPALRYLGILLLFLLFYLLIFRPLKRRVFAYVDRGPQLGPGQAPQLAGASGQLSGQQQLALPEGAQPQKRKEPSEEEKYGGEVTELAQKKPEVVTELVKEWLSG